jgi:hypothetical protein
LTTFQARDIIRPEPAGWNKVKTIISVRAISCLQPTGICLSTITGPTQTMQPLPRQEGRVTLFALLLIVFAASMSYWLWRAHAQVSLEIELACRIPAAETCVSAKARYMDSFYAAWFSQMFPWILPFIPAFIYVFFFRWLRRNKQPPVA